MCGRWGCSPEDVACDGAAVLWDWHERHPPTDDEKLHNYVVFKLQNNTNPLISNATTADALLREMYPVHVLRLRRGS
eukprot:3526146-Rhodomonas_salina.1